MSSNNEGISKLSIICLGELNLSCIGDCLKRYSIFNIKKNKESYFKDITKSIESCETPYILFCDSNCEIINDFMINRGMYILDNYSDIDFIYSDGEVNNQVLFLPAYTFCLMRYNKIVVNIPILVRKKSIVLDDRFYELFLCGMFKTFCENKIGYHIPKHTYNINNVKYPQEELNLI